MHTGGSVVGKLKILSAIAVCFLSGCALSEKISNTNKLAKQVETNIDVKQSQFKNLIVDTDEKVSKQRVNRPWIVGRPQPLSREISLPTALQKNINTTLLFDEGALDLYEIAERITEATDIAVHVKAETMLPVHMFMPKFESIDVGMQNERSNKVLLKGNNEALAKTLDRISAALSVNWVYKNDRIEFFRTETRVFDIQALTLNSSASATLGQNSNSSNNSFSSGSQTNLNSDQTDSFEIIKARIQAFMTRSGLLVAQQGASSNVVITDTPETLDNIAKYIERENRVLTKRVRLIFEEITLITNNSTQGGLDWDVVFNSAKIAARASINTASSVESSLLGLGIKQGPYSGSDAVISALSEVGTVVRRSSVPVLTLNRRPVTHAVRNTFSYIDKVDTTTYNDGAGVALPSVSVSQKEETVGSLLTLVPEAQADGRVLLSMAYDNTVAQPIKTIKFGDKTNPLQLQQVSIDGNGTVQQVLLEPGQPVLISGFDKSQDEAYQRRLLDELPLIFGGNDKSNQEQIMTVIIITAQTEEEV